MYDNVGQTRRDEADASLKLMISPEKRSDIVSIS